PARTHRPGQHPAGPDGGAGTSRRAAPRRSRAGRQSRHRPLSAPIDLRLLPATAAVSADGRLSIGGCDLGQLAERFGTPLFVYDEAHLRARCREYVAAVGADGVAYAGKAFLCRAMVRLVAEEGLHLDVATGGELHVALSAGFPATRIVFHGNNKSDDELASALAAGVVVGLAAEVEAVAGPGAVKELNLGGGLGIAYHDGDEPPTVADYAAVLRRAVDDAVAAAGLSHRPALLVEPGRSIAAAAGVTLYRVGTIKEIAGVRTYVAVDGGMSDNARPATYGARYEAFLPERVRAERPRVVTVAGKHCEQGDLLVRDATLPADLAVGDLLCTPATGAYGYAMASNY